MTDRLCRFGKERMGWFSKKSVTAAKRIAISPPKPDAASKTNLELLAGFVDAKKVFTLPWLGKSFKAKQALKSTRVQRTLRSLAE